ncbi:hypothetical protein LTR08_003002 [Meristemomyces frigidus]|nr:hypothetical protein LTR08_003002 [Meristemomyces frigidus]
MAANKPTTPAPKGQANPKKRKDPPSTTASTSTSKSTNTNPHKRPKLDHRAKQRDARQLATQPSRAAFANGELDVDKFVRAREYEITALEEGMARSRKALNKRAFQQVPKELRRRTASHNVKKAPKRLRERGKREMMDDNTPTVTARRRKPTRHMRLRLETAKKLRALGSKRKTEKEEAKAETAPNTTTGQDPTAPAKPNPANPQEPTHPPPTTTIRTRPPKVKSATLAKPPIPKSKFRKRQLHKSWLPTHLFHAKRARLTAPSAPLWRFSIPLTPTAKSYRPTHRAVHERGAVAWDMSYMSTIGLEGREEGLVGILRAMGVGDGLLEGKQAGRWRRGVRVQELWLHEREGGEVIAPVCVIWCVAADVGDGSKVVGSGGKRKMLLRVHPSAFFQLWEQVLRLAKVAKPEVSVEDLRFEIGSIEITGPGATEALLGALWPAPSSSPPAAKSTSSNTEAPITANITPKANAKPDAASVGSSWTALAGLTNPALLPANALLAFNIHDPRLHHPPRTIALPKSEAEEMALLELLAAWPVDASQGPSELFDRAARVRACKALGSQKAVNRRKALAKAGEYPEVDWGKDARIPVVLYCQSSTGDSKRGAARTQPRAGGASWTLLLPWKCVQPVWYSLLYYPLSTGQQPRFGGLDELRQLSFEAGKAWFPGDFPGTRAGWEWEVRERGVREGEWRKRPRGKRVGFEGEVGVGWGCDWARLLAGPPLTGDGGGNVAEGVAMEAEGNEGGKTAPLVGLEHAAIVNDSTAAAASSTKPPNLTHLSAAQALSFLASPPTPATNPPPNNISVDAALVSVHLTLLARGVPKTCARIYRLPSTNAELKRHWLALLPHHQQRKGQKGSKHSLPARTTLKATANGDTEAPSLQQQQQQRLARALLQPDPPRAGGDGYPECPGEEDLVGFVTAGNFNLGEGRGAGVGCVVLGRVMGVAGEGGLCVVRNSGEGVGRLGRWVVV